MKGSEYLSHELGGFKALLHVKISSTPANNLEAQPGGILSEAWQILSAGRFCGFMLALNFNVKPC